MDDSGVQECDVNHIYELVFDDDTTFRFLLRNSSNGYYDGYIKETTNIEKKLIKCPRNSLIILVGLPGCGKSTYGNMLNTSIKNSVFFDDVDISLESTISDIRQQLYFDKKVIVAHTRLCLEKTYNEFIQRCYLYDTNSIITYCFLPDVEQSIYNVKNRETSEIIISDINSYAEHYKQPFGYNAKKLTTYKKINIYFY